MASDFPGWSKNATSFCIYAKDWDGHSPRIIFLTDPSLAYTYWNSQGFTEMIVWMEEGCKEVGVSERSPEAFWILSPDIGKGG